MVPHIALRSLFSSRPDPIGSSSRWRPGVWILFVLWFISIPSPHPLRAADPTPLPLPALAEWHAELLTVSTASGVANLTVPRNYDIGRAVSPEFPVAEGALLTFAANVQPSFAGHDPSFYRCWLEVEFLEEKKVLATKRSPELIGTQGQSRLLGVTALAPKGATAVRVVISAQNKYWNIVKNEVSVRDVRLLRLAGGPRGALEMKVATGLPRLTGARTARVAIRGEWPEGTAVAIQSTRGKAPHAVLLQAKQAEITLAYSPEDVGGSDVTISVLEAKASLRVPDPMAARLEIASIQADSAETPALLQLVKDGVMIPGRYQVSTPGIFMKAPWSIDLAPGKWQVRVRRGSEFQSLERELEVKSGETVTWDQLVLTRHVDVRKAGWYGGDADGDVYHGERIYSDLSAQSAVDISRAMGLDWAGVGNWGSPTPQTWGEAKAAMRELSGANFLFLWTDEKPKTGDGHACFVGIDRPDGDPFGWGWAGIKRPLRNFEALQLVRSAGGATFANHPLRWWMSGEKFTTNMYASLPFDLCAAGLLDGYNVTEKPLDIMVWSMLLDRGYRVAATTGADFALDRPIGPVPGKIRMYAYCPDGLSASALAKTVRNAHTVVSTGPVLLADIDGRPPGTMLKTGQAYQISTKAWARADEADHLQRIELWAHGKVVATETFKSERAHAEHTFSWRPQGEWDWVAVRAVSRRGWAITSAFYAASDAWRPPQPVECRLTLSAKGLSADQQKRTVVQVWDMAPELTPARKLSEHQFANGASFLVPASGTVVVLAPNGQRKEVSIYDATGMPELVKQIASGAQRERPLLDWKTYEEVLRRCREASVELTF